MWKSSRYLTNKNLPLLVELMNNVDLSKLITLNVNEQLLRYMY